MDQTKTRSRITTQAAGLVRTMRIKQWVKNGFIFVPLITAEARTFSQEAPNLIQDLADKAKELGDRGKALETTTIAEMTKVNNTMKIQNKVLLYGVTVLLVFNLYGAFQDTFVITPQLEEVNDVVTGPIKTANVKLDELITEMDHIVAFVESVEASQEISREQTEEVFDAVFDIRNILCNTEGIIDPTNCD